MPRKPGLPKRRNIVSLTWQQTLGLIQIIPISAFNFRDAQEREAAWRKNKSAILALQGVKFDVGKATTSLRRALKREVWFAFFERPLAFFQYDMHEVFGDSEKTSLGFKNFSTLPFGISACSPEERAVYDRYGGQPPTAENAMMIYENQKEYLISKNLLNRVEKVILKGEKSKR